jgi:flagellar motor switch/type III secretory pathway protein FliN
MSEPRPEAAALLQVWPNLREDFCKIVAEALIETFHLPPKVKVTAAKGTAVKEAERDARSVLIRRSNWRDAKEQLAGPEDELVLTIADLEIEVEPVKLSISGNTWLLENSAAVVSVIKSGDKPVKVAGGGTYTVSATDFQFQIRSWRFDVKTQAAQVDVKIDGPQPPAAGPNWSTVWFAALRCWCQLKSPEPFWAEEKTRVQLALRKAWERTAETYKLRNPDPIEFQADAPAAALGPFDSYAVTVTMSGAANTLELLVPVAFYTTLREWIPAGDASPLQQQMQAQIVRRRRMCAGEQELRLRELRTLGPDKVLVLKPDSAAVLDPDSNSEWPLLRGAARWELSSQKIPFRVGEKKAQVIRNGGHVAQTTGGPDTDSLTVRIQAIVATEEVKMSDVAKYNPGSELPLLLAEKSEVDLAINGKILGKGRLVKLPAGGIGVQVLNWNV